MAAVPESGVAVLATDSPGLLVDVAPTPPVAPVAGAFCVAAGLTAPSWVNGQASRSTGKSVHLLASAQILTTSGVISGPLHSTICRPLITSTVVHEGWASAVVVVDGAGEVILKVAVSGRTSKAWARVSTQN